MTALAYALLGALGLGMSDYLGGVASRRVRAMWVICCTYPLSIVLLAVVVLVGPGGMGSAESVSGPSLAGFVVGVIAGMATGGAVWSFYEALARGPMSIISPIAAVMTAGLPVLAGIALGERPSLLVLVGIVGAVVATILVSLEAPTPGTSRSFTVPIAVLTVTSGVLFGLYLILMAYAPNNEGLYPVLWSRIGATTVIVAGLSVLALRHRGRGGGADTWHERLPLRRLLPLAAVIAVLDVIANTAYFVATQHGMLSVVAVVTSLYPAVTVLAALTHGGEQLRALQVAGLAAAAGSVALITLA